MIEIHLKPEIEERFLAAAEACGMNPETYAEKIIAAETALTREKPPLTKAQLDHFLAVMREGSENFPVLPESAYTRESFYQDHD